jgi:hypothetical protein
MYSVRFGGEFGLRIRSADMPQPPYEGLNRALPTAQVVKFYSLERTNWGSRYLHRSIQRSGI